MALAPRLQIIAPWKIDAFREEFPGRAEMIAYCRKHKIPVEASAKKPYSMDRNLLHISYEAGILEDPWFDPTTQANKGMFKLSVSPEDAPNRPEYVELDFEKGDCVAVNGRRLTPAGVLRALNKLGGKHGIGRVDLVENRFVGMKSRGVYETPGGTILMHGHRQVESLTMDREVMHLRDSLIPKYAELVYNGFWFAPEREALQALVDESQRFVTGHRAAQALQGQRHHLRPQVEVLALRHEGRVDGGREELVQPERRDRLHPAERAAAARAQPGAARAEGLSRRLSPPASGTARGRPRRRPRCSRSWRRTTFSSGSGRQGGVALDAYFSWSLAFWALVASASGWASGSRASRGRGSCPRSPGSVRVANTSLSVRLHQMHQSEPVKSRRRILCSFLASRAAAA